MMSVYYDFKCLVLKNKKIYLSKKKNHLRGFCLLHSTNSDDFVMTSHFLLHGKKKVKELISIILAKSSSQDFTVKPSIINTKMPIFVWTFQYHMTSSNCWKLLTNWIMNVLQLLNWKHEKLDDIRRIFSDWGCYYFYVKLGTFPYDLCGTKS